MQFTSLLATLVLSTSAFAASMEGMDMSAGSSMAGMDMSSSTGKDAMESMKMNEGDAKNKTSAKTSDEKTCKQMMKLTAIVNLAANETKLEKVTKGNETKMADIKTMAADASAKLDVMEQNATLVATCEVIDSVLVTKMMCKEMSSATKLIALAANQTALDAKTMGNATKADKIKAKAKAAMAQTKLTELQANATLTDICTTFQAEKKETATGKEAAAASASAGVMNAAEMLGAKSGLAGVALVVMAGMMML